MSGVHDDVQFPQIGGKPWQARSVCRQLQQGDRGALLAHLAIGEQLAYVNIGKDMLPEARFQAFGRWFIQGSWTDANQVSGSGPCSRHSSE